MILKKHGQLQVVVVYKSEVPGRYVLWLSERRWRSAKKNGTPFSCRVLEMKPEAKEMRVKQLVENLQRSNLNFVEVGNAARDLMDNCGLSIAAVGNELEISESYVRRAMELENHSSQELKEAVSNGTVTARAAYQASRIEDPEKQHEVENGLIGGTMNEEDARQAAAANLRSTRGRTTGSRKRTPKPSYTESMETDDGHRVTVTYHGAVESPGNAKLGAIAQAAAKKWKNRQESAA